MALPDTYKQVEYIESSGTQYIDTGIFASNNLQVETKVLIPSYSTIGPFFWCILSWWQNAWWNYYHCTPFQSKFYCWVNNSEVNWWTTAANQEYEIVFNNASNYLNVNWTNIVSVNWTVWYTWTTIWISWRWGIDWTTYWRFWYNRYYYFKIYNKTTGEYVRDMVPVIRKSDNKPGMYDLVNSVFYINDWTGEFKYPAQSWKITHIYLWTNLIRPPAPSEITEEFNLNSTTEKIIGKSWYKITKLILEESYSYSTSSWYIAWLRTYVSQDSSKPIIFCDNYTGWTYWYNYWYWMWSYWGICVKPANSWSESTQISIAQINSSATTSSQWAYKIIITEQSIEYHYGKTAWTWIQEWTSTLSSAVSWYINTLFTNTSIAVNEWTWWWPTFTAKVTVTYKPV